MKPDFSKIIEYISQKGKGNLLMAIGIVGILLIFISDMEISQNKRKNTEENQSLNEYREELEDEVTLLLREINGVGDVKVMITFESTSENIYVQQEKTANDTHKQTNENDKREETKTTFENQIVVVEQNGTDEALIEKTLQPAVQGVAVVCSGADDIKVVRDVTNSVSVVLNVPTHKICVTKKR